jgi:predicted ATPase
LAGDRDGALSMWRAYRDVRRTSTGTEPSLSLRELAARIESAPAGKPAPSRGPASNVPALPAFHGPLVGRAAEWEILLGAWGEASAGEMRVVIIDGETGVGRSRLLDDMLRLAAMRGATVLRGRAFEAGRDVPYGAMRDLLRGAVDAPGAAGTDATWLAEVARLAPEVRLRFRGLRESPGDQVAERSLLHEGVAQLLLAAADEAPLVVALDDVHWVDGDSCQLLHHLARRLEGAPVFWCATMALGAAARNAPGARLARTLGALPTARRLHLAPLSRDEVWALIRSLGRVQHPQGGARLATRVHELTGGNALYIVELLKTLFARGWLAVDPTTSEWTFSAGGVDVLEAGEMFPSVRDGVAERVAALPDEEHALLLTIAASGHGCESSLLSYVHGISRLRAAHTADALTERHLVTEANGTYRCAHALIASVVLDSVGPARRREVHRMIALALTDAAASVGRAADPGTVARHAAAGAETAMAHRYALVASEQSAAQDAWDDALAWLDLAAACAEMPADIRAVNNATASLLERAGRPSRVVRADADRATTPSIVRSDVDLTGTIERSAAETATRR